MNSKQHLKEFYNYKYWREVQRNQLTISSNIFFAFSTVTVGFILNFIVNEKLYCPLVKKIFLFSIILFLFSIFCYVILNIIKLVDYRKTASLIYCENTCLEVERKTKLYGKAIWFLFYSQILFTVFGLIITLLTFFELLF